jgi:hypothetical protein
MGQKRVLWEIRVLNASAVLVETAYAPDEKTACKTALKELAVRPVDQNRLLIRRTAWTARSAVAFTLAIGCGGLNRMAASAALARPARRAIILRGTASPA